MPEQSTKSTAKKGGLASAVAVAVIGAVFAAEGGYVNNPRDPGGETNHGVTVAVARKHGWTGPMKDLPKSKAQEIYYQDYIVKPGYEPFLELSPAVAEEVIDSGANAGPARSSRWLQISINALNRGGKDYTDVAVDGNVGPSTVNAYKSLVAKRGSRKACELVLKLLDAQQAQHYLNLTNLETFTPGWVDNRIRNVPTSRCV